MESLVRGRLVPKGLKDHLLAYFSLTHGQPDVVLSIFPNRKHTRKESLYLLFTGLFGMDRFFTKIFEMFQEGFIAPEADLHIPKDIVKEAISIALNEREIEKLEDHYNMKAHEANKAKINGKNSKKPLNSHIDNDIPFIGRKSSLDHRLSMISNLENEDDASENSIFSSLNQSLLHSTPSLRRVIWKENSSKINTKKLNDSSKIHEEINELKKTVLNMQSSINIILSKFQEESAPGNRKPFHKFNHGKTISVPCLQVNVPINEYPNQD